MKNKNFIFEILIVIIGGISIVLNFILFKDWRGILYYTILSNLFVFLFYLIVVIKKIRNKLKKTDKYYMLKGLLLISILCTMFVYNFTIASSNNIYTGHPIISGSVHILVPLLVLMDCLMFSNGKVLKYKYVIIWELSIIAYYILINIYRIFGGTFLEGKIYPYDIFNYEIHGTLRVTINGIVLLILYALIGIIVVFVNNKMRIRKNEGE